MGFSESFLPFSYFVFYRLEFVWGVAICFGQIFFFISIFKSVYGILKLLSMDIFQAILAAKSASLFPLIPMWLRILHSSISLVFDRDFNLFNICVVRGLSSFFLLFFL